jgi:hypothetical protein
MNINSQHHNLLGNQISPKSENFFIWRPFCTLVTMETAAILNFFQPPKSCHTLWWIFLQIFMKYGRCCHKKREKFKVLGIGWNLIEMLYGMCINGFEAWKFQNACRCHGNRKDTIFNTKVNNNNIFSDLVCNSQISKPQNYVYTCQTKFLESFIQFQAP